MDACHPAPGDQPGKNGPGNNPIGNNPAGNSPGNTGQGETADPVLDGHWRGARDAMKEAGLDLNTVWMRYFGMTGEAGEYEIDAYLNGSLPLPNLQADLLAHAINELIDELPRAPYTDQPGHHNEPGSDDQEEPGQGP